MTKGLESLETLMNDYYEMCQDLCNNDDEYQRNNLTSPRAIIEKELKDYNKLNDRLERINYFLGVDVFTFVEIMNPFYNIYVWNNHNKQIVKLCCFGARRTYNGKEIYVENTSCIAWLKIKEYGNTWSLSKNDLEKKWLNNKEKENGRK